MLDTIGLRYYTKDTSFWNKLDNYYEPVDNNTGEAKKKSGKLKNFELYEIDEGFKLEGSIAKYFLGDNLKTLNRKNIIQAIENLSDCLSLKIKDSKMYRIDFAQNFIMNDTVRIVVDSVNIDFTIVDIISPTRLLLQSITNYVPLIGQTVINIRNAAEITITDVGNPTLDFYGGSIIGVNNSTNGFYKSSVQAISLRTLISL